MLVALLAGAPRWASPTLPALRHRCTASSAADSVCLIDSHNLAYRMHFGMRPLTGPSGEPVHAVLGFCNKLVQLRTLFPNHLMLAAFDTGKSEARTEMLAEYKGTRVSMPNDLSTQMRLIHEATHAFGVPSVGVLGYEADDIIATCVHKARKHDFAAVSVVSTDKDLLQLVSRSGTTPNVTVYDDRRKLLIDAARVKELHGVEAHQIVDYLALVGDNSDNVPGVPGVGPKSAAKFLLEHGDLEAVLGAAPTMRKSKRQQALVDFAETARLAKRLVTLQYDVPGVPELHEPWVQTPFAELPDLQPFLQAHGFAQLERRLFGVAAGKFRKLESGG
uniref:5'-3' exonuclease domain-containing protein n=1 Tax=Coccolithus braarudii TaxID=221442 RepID=A0A7S0LFN0_9EUKA|mmetsp:Transcript_37509/g.79903  ORF Transcript_37509/g.79903 Transcript_37509/m.79903 type:complete len:333 (+) Transcript_37509:21-1019(+)